MLLDINLIFNSSTRKFHPGDLITFDIIVDSTFELTCRSLKVRLTCPFDNRKEEYFRQYKFAKFLEKNEEARDFKLKKGLNTFKVDFEVPSIESEIFESMIFLNLNFSLKINFYNKQNLMI